MSDIRENSKSEQKRVCYQTECAVREDLRHRLSMANEQLKVVRNTLEEAEKVIRFYAIEDNYFALTDQGTKAREYLK